MINKKLYIFSGNIKKHLFYTTFLSCLKLIGTLLFSWLFAKLLSDIINKNFNQNYFIIFFIILIIILIRQFSTHLIDKSLGNLVIDIKIGLRTALFNKILKLGLNYSQFFKIQEFIHLSVDNVEQLEVYFGGYLTQFYYCIFSSIILFCSIYIFNLKIALILLVFSLFIPLFLYISLNKVTKIQKKYFAKYTDVGILFLDSLQGITTLKLYGTDLIREMEIKKISEEFRKETMKVLRMQLISIAIVNWIIYAGTILAIIYAIKSFFSGNLNLFSLFFIFMLTPEFFIPMRTLTSLFHIAMTGVAASENILNFLNAPEYKNKISSPFPNNTDICIKNMNFSYPDGTHALKDININFKKSNLTAIVGKSGCGKSTLASILAGEVKSNEANKIKIGNINFNEIKFEHIPQNIIKINYDSHIFNGTVRNNLLIAKPNATDNEMIEILKKLKLWSIFEKINGLDTILKSQGKNLSGGQVQRIALARALLYDAKIYIFDEATSNIDIESEEIIVNMIYEISKTKNVIFITHKLTSTKNADLIYVLDNGKIVQFGKHQELLEEDGIYQNLYKYQDELEKFLNTKEENKNEKQKKI